MYKDITSPESSHESVDGDIERSVVNGTTWHGIAECNQVGTGGRFDLETALDVSSNNMDVCTGASANVAGGCRALRVPQEVGEVLCRDGERERAEASLGNILHG